MIQDHEEVISKCEGCIRILYSVVSSKRICACYKFPRCQWWFDQKCDQATHHPQVILEDPY